MLKLFVFITVATVSNQWCNIVQCAPQSEYYRVEETVAEQNNLEEEPVKYDGAQLWNILFKDESTRNTIIGLQDEYDVAMWNVNETSVDLFLKQSAVNGATNALRAANVSYSILINDVQKEIEAENPPKEEIEQLQNRKARNAGYNLWHGVKIPDTISRHRFSRLKGAFMGFNSFEPYMELWPKAHWGHRLTWSAFHRYTDILGYIDYLAKTYPDLCSVQTIGRSHENRPLKVLRISNNNPGNPKIWIDGGIHAREWISPAAVTYIVNHIVEEWETLPKYIQNIDWYVQPVVNPDGYEYSHVTDRLWRKNRGGSSSGRCAGADLNRNYGYHWGESGASKQPCSEIFAGPRPFSEPESRAQKKFFQESEEKFSAFLTFHSYGQYILYPWGYDKVVPPDHADLKRVGLLGAKSMKTIAGESYSVGPSGSLLYPAAGASDDWAKSIGIKYTYTVELRDKGRHGFILPASLIEETSREAQEFVFTVAKTVNAAAAGIQGA